jgi:plasmid stability protein
MAVSLSIKAVPDHLARTLRRRAAANHRSVQGELMHILESALQPRPFQADVLAARLRDLRFSTPPEAVDLIRQDRDR